MNEHVGSATHSDLPPILPPPNAEQSHHATPLEPTYAALRRLPARDTDKAVFGGVCVAISERVGIAPVAVRAAAVVSAFFGGLGVGLYLVAWALMPDARGNTHVERALRLGQGRSLLVLAVGALAALSLLTGGLSFLVTALPLIATLAILVGGGMWAWNRAIDRSQEAGTSAG